jgi:hypothetical protein
MEDLDTNLSRIPARTHAEHIFEPEAKLGFRRSAYQPHEQCVYIYSSAVDVANNLTVATVKIANVTGINDHQIEFLVNRIADAIVETGIIMDARTGDEVNDG